MKLKRKGDYLVKVFDEFAEPFLRETLRLYHTGSSYERKNNLDYPSNDGDLVNIVMPHLIFID